VRCHDLRAKLSDCRGSHVQCFLRFRKSLKESKCSVLGIARRALPVPAVARTESRRLDGDEDDFEESKRSELSNNGGLNGKNSGIKSTTANNNNNATSANATGVLSGRLASSASTAPAQDNTLFYVLIGLMSTLIFLVIVGIVLMCLWWQPKSNSNYVEPEDDDNDSSVFEPKKGKGGMK
jgi:hypothetical protein